MYALAVNEKKLKNMLKRNVRIVSTYHFYIFNCYFLEINTKLNIDAMVIKM